MTIAFEKNGTTLTVKPEGRMDTATSPELNQRMQPELQGMNAVIMDLEKVDYVSSGGLRLLLELEQRMEECGGSLKIIHVNSYIIEVLDMTGFIDILHIE